MKQILIVTLLVFVSCGQTATSESKVLKDRGTVQPTDAEREKLIENAINFINAYVENCNKMKEAVGISEWVNSNQLTTARFKSELKRILDEAYRLEPEVGLGAGPIFDAQDYPHKGFAFHSMIDNTNYIVVKGKDWPEFKLMMKMVKESNVWLVDGCGIINMPAGKQISR